MSVMHGSMYHSLLRIATLVCAIVLAFDSGVFSSVTKELSYNTQLYLAQSIGVGATVKPTEVNQLTAQIAQRDKELDDREAAIVERELEIGIANGVERSATPNISTYILSTLLFILIVLIVLNYALDFARERRMMYADTKST